MWTRAERSAAVLGCDVRGGVVDARAALHLRLLRSRVERTAHNVGQADVPHVGLRSQSECR